CRSKAYTTKVTGTRKLPSRMTVGTRLVLAVAKVTTTLATHSTRPTTKTRSNWRPPRSRAPGPRAWPNSHAPAHHRMVHHRRLLPTTTQHHRRTSRHATRARHGRRPTRRSPTNHQPIR